jgi:flavin reductase (DIM6/NTAB) family NADH-FMN oxidoreductase RutF
VVNLTTEALAFATDYCGVRSGRDVDKFSEMKLTKEKATHVAAPMIGESPVNIECRVVERKELGSHDMFIAEVLCVHAAEAYMDATGKFDLAMAKPIVYDHGKYYGMGRELGKFGYSIKKKETPKRSATKNHSNHVTSSHSKQRNRKQ